MWMRTSILTRLGLDWRFTHRHSYYLPTGGNLCQHLNDIVEFGIVQIGRGPIFGSNVGLEMFTVLHGVWGKSVES